MSHERRPGSERSRIPHNDNTGSSANDGDDERSRPQRIRCRHRKRIVIECVPACTPLPGHEFYEVTNLTSNVPGLARFVDPALVNAWGLSHDGMGPWWVASNGTGVVALCEPTGSPHALAVTIPPPTPSVGRAAPTGIAFNAAASSHPTAFVIASGGRSAPSVFLFATEEGTLSGWNPAVDVARAVVVVDRSAAGAIYKAIAMGFDVSGAPVLYATNFRAGVVEMFNASFAIVRTFTDPALIVDCPFPNQCYAPFGIAALGSAVYVTFALQAPGKADVQSAIGNGFVSVFDAGGSLVRRIASKGPLNSPWGLAIAPRSGFGDAFAGALLVGNFGDGLVHAYDRTTNALLGPLLGATGSPLKIDGLWALRFGNGESAGPSTTLFFTAGPNGETAGLFGSITLGVCP